MAETTNAILLTRDELRQKENAAFQRGVERGKFDAASNVNTELLSLRAENARMREAARAASAMLKVPAAEYVPAMSEAWEVLDKALEKMS